MQLDTNAVKDCCVKYNSFVLMKHISYYMRFHAIPENIARVPGMYFQGNIRNYLEVQHQ